MFRVNACFCGVGCERLRFISEEVLLSESLYSLNKDIAVFAAGECVYVNCYNRIEKVAVFEGMFKIMLGCYADGTYYMRGRKGEKCYGILLDKSFAYVGSYMFLGGIGLYESLSRYRSGSLLSVVSKDILVFQTDLKLQDVRFDRSVVGEEVIYTGKAVIDEENSFQLF